MKKINSYIRSAELLRFKNENTGEVTERTKIYYTREMENTERVVGLSEHECFVKGNHLEKISKIIMKPLQLELEERPIKNGCKYIIKKINNEELK